MLAAVRTEVDAHVAPEDDIPGTLLGTGAEIRDLPGCSAAEVLDDSPPAVDFLEVLVSHSCRHFAHLSRVIGRCARIRDRVGSTVGSDRRAASDEPRFI